MITAENRWMKGKSYKKYGYTVETIAGVVGKKVGTVRQDRSRGKFDPESLESVVRYCAVYLTKV